MDERRKRLYPRFAAAQVLTALKDTPVVLVTGPRQCGKTTLVRSLVAAGREFITMDNRNTVLASARTWTRRGWCAMTEKGDYRRVSAG